MDYLRNEKLFKREFLPHKNRRTTWQAHRGEGNKRERLIFSSCKVKKKSSINRVLFSYLLFFSVKNSVFFAVSI